MEPPIKIYGARASIHMRYAGDLPALAAKLSSGLVLPDFEIEPREDPPHDVMGSLQAMGWEAWLEGTNPTESFQYRLRMETAHSLEESFNNQMHDLSPWLARYVSSICEIESLVSGTQVMFSQGKPKQAGFEPAG